MRSPQETVDFVNRTASYLRSDINADESANLESLLIRRDVSRPDPLSYMGFDPAWVCQDSYPDPTVIPTEYLFYGTMDNGFPSGFYLRAVAPKRIPEVIDRYTYGDPNVANVDGDVVNDAADEVRSAIRPPESCKLKQDSGGRVLFKDICKEWGFPLEAILLCAYRQPTEFEISAL